MSRWTTAAVVILLGVGAAPALAGDALGPPERIEADGAPIDTEVGHAAPAVHDWDGDGLPDLLVGQMGGGKLRIYRNAGTRTQPRFQDFQVFAVGEADATVPSG